MDDSNLNPGDPPWATTRYADVSYTANDKSTLEARKRKHVVELSLAQSAISHKEHDCVRAPKHDYANVDTVVDAPKEHGLFE